MRFHVLAALAAAPALAFPAAAEDGKGAARENERCRSERASPAAAAEPGRGAAEIPGGRRGVKARPSPHLDTALARPPMQPRLLRPPCPTPAQRWMPGLF